MKKIILEQMKKIIFSILALTLMMLHYSCTDELEFDSPSFLELQKGSFIRFTENFQPAKAVDLGNFNGTFLNTTLEDLNNNTASFSLTLTASVAGVTYIVDDFIVINSFPSQLNITSQQIADAVGFDINTLDFGDSFSFVGKSTRTDGKVFYQIEPTVTNASRVDIGKTSKDLKNSSAMQFDFIFACPTFNQADIVGTYNLVRTTWNSIPQPVVQIIPGENPNQFIIEDLTRTPGIQNLIIDVSSDGITLTVKNQYVYFHPNYGDITIDGNGLVFSCLGTIDLTLTRRTFSAGDFDPVPYILQKQ